MNIEIVKINPEKDVYFESSLDSVRNFGIILNKTSSIIKMLHWFIKDYNTHKIFGDLYSNLIELFDNDNDEGKVNDLPLPPPVKKIKKIKKYLDLIEKIDAKTGKFIKLVDDIKKELIKLVVFNYKF